MRTAIFRTLCAMVVLGLASSCGLELIAGNFTHRANERPASKLTGRVALQEGTTVPPDAGVLVSDADGKALEPFKNVLGNDGSFEVRLPSAKYSNLVVSTTFGNATIRALVPAIGEESALEVDVDARSMTEALITQARLSADKATWKQVTPSAYVATRALIREAFDRPGPTQDLLNRVNWLLTKYSDPTAGGDPVFFSPPVLNPDFSTKESAINPDWVDRVRPDLDGDGSPNGNTVAFDTLLATVARLYRPAGCPDPDRLRVVFTVDFNDGRKNGNCGVSDRFKWAKDKPGKSMYFVGWLHKDSPNQDPLVASSLGNGVPNQLAMKDDGTGGDETAGDNIWTIYFDLPRGARVGFKYTWGLRGAPWTGSEEWPGNSRIIEVVDVNGDDLVYRRDVFADEATNKDRSNLNTNGQGSIDWTTDLRGIGIEARELMVDTDNDCKVDTWVQPKAIGPLTLACTQ
jgi:hypothetical protein